MLTKSEAASIAAPLPFKGAFPFTFVFTFVRCVLL